MSNTEHSITVVRGNPTPDEIAAIVAALALRTSATTRIRRWGTPQSTWMLTPPDPWRRATGWKTAPSAG